MEKVKTQFFLKKNRLHGSCASNLIEISCNKKALARSWSSNLTDLKQKKKERKEKEKVKEIKARKQKTQHLHGAAPTQRQTGQKAP